MSIRATLYGFGSSAEAPTASFTASPSAFPIGGSISFTDTSTNTPTRWLWIVTGGQHTFIGGTDENSQNPEIRFFEDVTYTVYLRAWNVYGTSLQSNTYIAAPAPVASFTISDSTPNAGQIVTFTDTSTESPTSWSWAVTGGEYGFVENTTSASQNPKIKFYEEDTAYTVQLTASNASGTGVTSDTVTTEYFIATNGTLLVDANKSASYPFSGSTWSDLFNSNNGTLYNHSDTAYNKGGIVFNGSSTRVDFGDINFGNTIAISTFVEFSTIQNCRIVSKDNYFGGTDREFLIQVDAAGTTVKFITWNTSNSIDTLTATITLSTDTVYHIYCYWDGTNKYISVQPIGGTATTNTKSLSGNLKNSAQPLIFGCAQSGGSRAEFFDGIIYATAIWSATPSNYGYDAIFNRFEYPTFFEYDPFQYGDADNGGTQVPTTYGSPTYNSAGYYSFDGTDDAFYYDYDGGINDATGAIEVFIDWDNTQNGIAICWARDNSSTHRGFILLKSSDNRIQFNTRKTSSADQIQLDWNFSGASGKYHIVLNKTADGGSSPSYNYELYINGVNQGNPDSDASSATQGYWFDDQAGFTPYNITVGGRFANNVTLPNAEIIGDIYRAAIYQDPLSAQAVSARYNYLLNRIK